MQGNGCIKLWCRAAVAAECRAAGWLRMHASPPALRHMQAQIYILQAQLCRWSGLLLTILCAALLLWFCAIAAYNPYILCAACIFFCLLLVPFSLGQFRLVVVLGLLTFASVVLCQYAGCCGAVGSVTYLVGRILATGG